MNKPISASVPGPHRDFLRRAVEVLSADRRIAGLAVGGSWLSNSMDEFSDLDLVVAVADTGHAGVMAERQKLAASLGTLLSAFTGEHVHEPRLLICLYDAPLLHVDLKFVALADLGSRVEDPAVLWERDEQMTRAMQQGRARYPAPNLQWIEDRFWVWLHYGAGKIARGEIFEAIAFISFLRVEVLGPLGLQSAGARPNGVRKIEMLAPDFAGGLARTVSTYEARDCARALNACAEIYQSLRGNAAGLEQRRATEMAAMKYLTETARQLS